MQRPQKTFARELQELRELGFGEGLEPARIPAQRHASADVLRLECGSMGMAVEIAQDEGRGLVSRGAARRAGRRSIGLHERPLARGDGDASQSCAASRRA
jgi:hypothetical protein